MGRDGTSTPSYQSTASKSRSSPFTFKFLLGHSLFSSRVLFVFSLFRISGEVEIRHDFPQVFMGDSATHAHNFPGQHLPYHTQWVSSLVARDVSIYTAQKKVCVTPSNGRHINKRHCGGGWWSALGSITSGSLGSQKAIWIWLMEVLGVKWPATAMAPMAAANFTTACWPVFQNDRMLTSAEFSTVPKVWAASGSHHFSFCRCIVPLGSRGSYCKEFEDILLYLQNIKDSKHCEIFPLSYEWNPEHYMGSAERA